MPATTQDPAEVIVTDPPVLTHSAEECPPPAPPISSPVSTSRIFRSRMPGSRFQFAHNDKEIFFVNGWYETSDPQELQELGSVADKVPTIFTDSYQDAVQEAVLAARVAIGERADFASVMNKLVASTPVSPVPGVMQVFSAGLAAQLDNGQDLEKQLLAAITSAGAPSNTGGVGQPS